MTKCKTESCDREAVSQGYCTMCYKRGRRKGTITNILIRNTGTCTEEGCDRPQFSKGLCVIHYRRIQRAGNKVRCSVEGCNKPSLAQNLCPKHYSRMLQGRDLLQEPVRINGGKCSVEGCEKVATQCGMCPMHYTRMRNHGDVNFVVHVQKHATKEESLEARRQNGRRHRYQKRSRSGSLSERWTKAQVVEKSNGICALCGEPIDMTLKNPDRFSFSIDHIIPLNKGGSNLFDNVQAAHLRCNCIKQDKVG